MKLVKFLFSRLAIFGIILLLQVIWLFSFVFYLGEYSAIIHGVLTLLSIGVTLWIVYLDENPAYKLAWIVPILLFPLFGGLLYLAMGNKRPRRKFKQQEKYLRENATIALNQDPSVVKEIEEQGGYAVGQVHYLSKKVGYPIYKNTDVKYYSIGEDYFEDLIYELKQAKHFIFMEYFIVAEGYMWNTILDILVEKVKEGVEVRFIYDDVGCVSIIPYHYDRKLEAMGIQCIAFNPFVPFLSMAMNNRDHRKITVIDGHTGFTGGINLADEYINRKVRFGHWKDTGMCIKGDAVWNLTVMFLKMWNFNRPSDKDFTPFHVDAYRMECMPMRGKTYSDGYVLPFGDSPLDNEVTSENTYMNIINGALRYVYIFTPYLIIDFEMTRALCLAARRGVDVRIVTPGIPDKKTVYGLTRSYYQELLEHGVKIYEYSPGFLHAKCFVCDDEIATVGTINMDYRSLYLHFECGIYLYRNSVISEIKQDILATISKSKQVTLEMSKKGKAFSLFRAILRLFAPLM
ncbi:cardiolipin synthetase [Lachnospiraceae bacterium KM106-2]|nr:cardiolipin synthetase [Lachnospiraceae bacterium KM106-2]